MTRSGSGFQHRLALWFIVATLSVGLIGALLVVGPAVAHGEGWSRVVLEQGEAQSYRWSVGAKAPAFEPLDQICAQVGIVSPPQPDVPYAEGNDVSICGRLRKSSDSVVSSTKLGSGETRVTLFVALYRPAVRKVTFILGTGERKVYRPAVAMDTAGPAKGMPVFRYLVASFEGETCIRRVTTSDLSGDVIDDEKKFSCPSGA